MSEHQLLGWVIAAAIWSVWMVWFKLKDVEKLVRKLLMESDETVNGYRDGFAGKQARSMDPRYQRGWNNGIADREKSPDAEQRLNAHFYLRQQRVDAEIQRLKEQSDPEGG